MNLNINSPVIITKFQLVDTQYINDYKALSEKLNQKRDNFNKEIELLEQEIQNKRRTFNTSIRNLDIDVDIHGAHIMEAATKIINNITNVILDSNFNNIEYKIGINNYIRKFGISILNDNNEEDDKIIIPYNQQIDSITFECINKVTDDCIIFYVEQGNVYDGIYETGYISIPFRYFQAFYTTKEVYVEDENNYIKQICNQIRDEENKQSEEEKRLKLKELYVC